MSTIEERYKEALTIYNNGDLAKAVPLIEAMANEGYAPAQLDTGIFYENGTGVSQDYDKALEWYHKSAEQGIAIAQFNIGCLYYYGEGIPQNYEKAVEWLKKAADQNLPEAVFNLAICYGNGQGVAVDIDKSDELVKKAAELGHQEAINLLNNQSIKNNKPIPKISIIAAIVLALLFLLLTGNIILTAVGAAVGFFGGKFVLNKFLSGEAKK